MLVKFEKSNVYCNISGGIVTVQMFNLSTATFCEMHHAQYFVFSQNTAVSVLNSKHHVLTKYELTVLKITVYLQKPH